MNLNQTKRVQEAQQRSQPQNSPPKTLLPGVSDLCSGFDVVKETHKGLIIDLQAPYHIQDNYCFPNDVQYIDTARKRTKEFNMYKNATEAERKRALKLDTKFLLGMFSASTSYGDNSSDKRDCQQAVLSEVSVVYSIRSKPAAQDLPLEANFAKAIERLPDSYNSELYRRFINDYGTHWIRKLDLGGELCIKSYIDNNTNVTAADVEAALQANLVKVSGSISASNNTTVTTNITNSHSFFFHRGGNVTGTQENWNQSLETAPAPFPVELGSLGDFFTNANKKSNFEKAVQDYVESFGKILLSKKKPVGTVIVGGPGGTEFSDYMNPNTRIISFTIYAGGAVHGLEVEYTHGTVLHGRNDVNGIRHDFTPGQYIKSIDIWGGNHGIIFIDNVILGMLVYLSTGEGYMFGKKGGRFLGTLEPKQESFGLVAFTGRAGDLLDAVGAVFVPMI